LPLRVGCNITTGVEEHTVRSSDYASTFALYANAFKILAVQLTAKKEYNLQKIVTRYEDWWIGVVEYVFSASKKIFYVAHCPMFIRRTVFMVLQLKEVQARSREPNHE
jgi:hypothetical protein